MGMADSDDDFIIGAGARPANNDTVDAEGFQDSWFMTEADKAKAKSAIRASQSSAKSGLPSPATLGDTANPAVAISPKAEGGAAEAGDAGVSSEAPRREKSEKNSKKNGLAKDKKNK